jgi:hypothetical protein
VFRLSFLSAFGFDLNAVLDVDIVPPFKSVMVVLRIIRFIGVILDTVRIFSACWVVAGSFGMFWIPIGVAIAFVAVFPELFAHLNCFTEVLYDK